MDEQTQQAPLLTAAALGDEPGQAPSAWLREGARVLALRAPRWQGLEGRPLTVAALVLASYVIGFVVQRALMDGAPQPHWAGFLAGWSGVAVVAWLCWVVARSRSVGESASASPSASPTPQPATMFALCCSASVVFGLAMGACLLALKAGYGPADEWPSGLQWTAFLLPVSWAGRAQIALLWRVAGTALARAAALLLTSIALVLNAWLAPPAFWWPEPAPQAEAVTEAVSNEDREADAGLPLTDEIVSAQPELLAQALGSLRPPQPGRVNVYAATYAPYVSENVFMRESAVVARTMRERFGADGRLVELVVNPATATTLPWATPLNLHKAITRMAAVMDREHDVLFLHLTSHGGADGQLANDTWPLQTEPMTPQLLKRWLDEAGVRWRVISVSACYSGSWIAPLAGSGTLVMTAADADHTSYGCGKRSELTFFGRAMYEDALRQTWSFTQAHAQARELIKQREIEAGKSDGYSNPQISEGGGIRAVLKRLEGERRDR